MTAERVNLLVGLLHAGGELPPDVVRWLVDGLQAWQQGRDLEAALGLHYADVQELGYDERDELLQAAIRLCPGTSPNAQASYFLEVINGRLRHPDEAGRHFTDILLRSRCFIPRSIRHLRSRILQGKRHDSWRQCERTEKALCPSRVARFNVRTLTKTGT